MAEDNEDLEIPEAKRDHRAKTKRAVDEVSANYKRARLTLMKSLKACTIGTASFMDHAKAIYENEWAFIETRIALGMLPEKFTVGSIKVVYVFKAHIVRFDDVGETTVTVPRFKAAPAPPASKEMHTATQSELDQLAALKKLEGAYQFVNKQLIKSAKLCNDGTNVGLRHTKLIRDLATKHLENRQSVGAIPQDIAAANATEGIRYVTYRSTDGTLKSVKVQSDEELRKVLAEQEEEQGKGQYTSDEDNAIRKELDEKYGTTKSPARMSTSIHAPECVLPQVSNLNRQRLGA